MTLVVALAAPGCHAVEPPGPPVDTTAVVVPGRFRWFAYAYSSGAASLDLSRVFFPSSKHEVIAVRKATGAILWRRTVTPSVSLPDAFGTAVAGPVVVFGDALLYAFDRELGTIRWVFSGDAGSNPGYSAPAAQGDVVFAGSARGTTYAVDANTGNMIWRAERAAPFNSSAYEPVVAGQQLFVGYGEGAPGNSGGLAAFDTRTGQQLWYYDFSSDVGPGQSARCIGGVVADSAMVFSWTEHGDIVAIDRATGLRRWRKARTDSPSPVSWRYSALAAGVLVVGAFDGHLEGLSSVDGSLLWSIQLTRYALRRPLVSDSERVFVTVPGGGMYVVDAATGVVRWSVGAGQMDAFGFEGPPAVDDSAVYIGGIGGLYAIWR